MGLNEDSSNPLEYYLGWLMLIVLSYIMEARYYL
jgi:hypothetical protein